MSKLESGWAKRKLIHELARMEKNQIQLAAEYGVVQSSISEFSTRHRPEIDAVKQDIENEFAGLWIVEKVNRLAEAQADVEAISEALGSTTDEKLLRVKLAIMRQVAEEMGQLKTNVEVGGKVSYVIEGIDLSRLT